MRSKSIVFLLLTALVWAPACKKNQEEETTKPEDDTWVPDESLEPEPAPQPVEPELSEEERLEKAKGYYVEAEGKAAEGDWEGALGLYEQAYQLVPGKHGFALKVGKAAEQVGDCEKAITYYEHFVTYAEKDKYEDDRKDAEASLAKLREDCG
ncbi:hypothetical protein G6O69_37340 [Pseudenhygromyxa sp. WMMC2535]|uniref:hypothetical protein n=1 Tax=Pseudenhygromyxa sp. WMMC2535 TaxID=2712867 RepID=UPI00155791F9|nr:hypothetical protein [Pseudenhygromyxa sp. WMMC2535]NVB40301.1 hypothetical protein [Pseudenhygromyxa sp. WMMC2535]NVB43540.1 hypothetical protein [Pseudenhygromyxa sp. WMMC2535]